MAVNPLTNKPVPPNSNFARALWAWVTAQASQDPLDTDADQQALLSFCGTVGCNVIFMDIWRYLGGGNWTAAKLARMQLFVDAANRSGIRVMAMCGNVDWGQNHAWVMKNIVKAIVDYNAMAVKPSQQFDGVVYDVEYWTNETSYPPATHLPGLMDLVKATKRETNLEVGLFAAFYLKDSTGSRALIDYCGKSAQDGEHMMDVCDFVVVGTYRNHAQDNGQDGPGQISLMQPWIDYAVTQGLNKGLYCGSETTDQTPAYITYFGKTKVQMEAEHALISNQFQVPEHSAFLGQAVHSYDGWKAMP